MEKEYITILDYPTTQVLICELSEGATADDDTGCEDFVDKIGLDSNNASWVVSGAFPLDLSKSSIDVLSKTMYKLRDEAYKRIIECFKAEPNKVIEFSQWTAGELDGICELSYNANDEVFIYDENHVDISDFCLEDLLFILEQF